MAPRPKKPEPRPAPRLYLITPPIEETAAFATALAEALSAGDVAAVLLRLGNGDERSLINRVKQLCPIVHNVGAALLLEGHVNLVARAGADGAHLSGVAAFNDTVERLKPERIAGCGDLASRHDAMVVAESGADYVMFGDPDTRGTRPSFAAVEERVRWWAELFEIPCVGYAATPDEIAPLVKAGADFVALGDWLWRDAVATIVDAARVLRLPENAI